MCLMLIHMPANLLISTSVRLTINSLHRHVLYFHWNVISVNIGYYVMYPRFHLDYISVVNELQ